MQSVGVHGDSYTLWCMAWPGLRAVVSRAVVSLSRAAGCYGFLVLICLHPQATARPASTSRWRAPSSFTTSACGRGTQSAPETTQRRPSLRWTRSPTPAPGRAPGRSLPCEPLGQSSSKAAGWTRGNWTVMQARRHRRQAHCFMLIAAAVAMARMLREAPCPRCAALVCVSLFGLASGDNKIRILVMFYVCSICMWCLSCPLAPPRTQ